MGLENAADLKEMEGTIASCPYPVTHVPASSTPWTLLQLSLRHHRAVGRWCVVIAKASQGHQNCQGVLLKGNRKCFLKIKQVNNCGFFLSSRPNCPLNGQQNTKEPVFKGMVSAPAHARASHHVIEKARQRHTL